MFVVDKQGRYNKQDIPATIYIRLFCVCMYIYTYTIDLNEILFSIVLLYIRDIP